MKSFFKNENSFVLNIIKVSSGNGLSKLLAFAVMPVLTNIYSPKEFGDLSVFISTLAILGSFITLRYSSATPIERDPKKILNLLAICLFFVFGITLLISIVFLILNIFYSERFDNNFEFFSIFICLSLFLKGLYEVFTSWCVRYKSFNIITKSKIYQSIVSSCVKVMLGVVGFKEIGLIIGHVFLEATGLSLMVKAFYKKNINFKKSINFLTIKEILIKYKKFPIFQLPSQILLSFNNNLIVFAISWFFGEINLGLFALALSIINAPLNIIGQAVSQVYYAEISGIGIDNRNAIKELTKNIFKKMSLIIFPLLIFVFYGEEIFSLIFGAEWQKAGLYAAILLPLSVSRFLISPVLSIFNLLNLQELQLKINFQRLILLIIFFIFIYLVSYEVVTTLILYSILMMMYNFYIYLLALKSLENFNEKT